MSTSASEGTRTITVVVFVVAGDRYAVVADAVQRVLPMVAIAVLPGAPPVVRGAVNVHGRILPVIDLRRRLELPDRDYGVDDRLLLVRTARRLLAVAIDEVVGLVEVAERAITPPEVAAPRVPRLAGVAPQPDGLLLIHDVDAFVSLDEDRAVERALSEGAR